MMDGTTRKLHPVLEVLIVAAVIFVITLAISWIINPILIQLVQNAPLVFYLIRFLSSVFGLFLGGFLCFKWIEKSTVPWATILLIAVVYQLFTWLPATMVTNFVGMYYGELALARYSQISAFVTPVLAAAVMIFVVRLLCAPRDTNTTGMQKDLLIHVLLLLFTCGIWNLIWIYRTTRYLNCLSDEEYRNPATKLLLCMFVPFYSIYWVYKSAQRIDKLAERSGVISDLAVVCLILEIFVPLIPPILMQDKINKILKTKTN